MAKDFTPTDTDLEAVWEHVTYEVVMFQYCARALVENVPAIAGDTLLQNVFLEAFAVHVRNLNAFLFEDDALVSTSNKRKGRTFPTDVWASQLVPDVAAWKTARGECPAALGKVKVRTDTEIVHLSYGRNEVGPEAKAWDVPAIYNALLPAIRALLQHQPADVTFPKATFAPSTCGVPTMLPEEIARGIGELVEVDLGTFSAGTVSSTTTAPLNTRSPPGPRDPAS